MKFLLTPKRIHSVHFVDELKDFDTEPEKSVSTV